MRRLAFVFCLFPLAVTAAPHTVLYRHPADARPAFVAGDLSGPTTLAPEAAARALLRSAPDLAPVEPGLLGAATVRRLDRGAVVRFELQHAGVPVADASVAVRLDDRGRARMVLGSPVRVDPSASATPSLAPGDARGLLQGRHAPHRAAAFDLAAVRLVWVPGPDRILRLAWEFRLPPTPVLAESLLFRVDAHRGALLTARNLVRFADQGKVYQWNPVKSTLQTVALPGRAPNAGQPADALSNPYVNVVNCKDNHNTIPLTFLGQTFNVHMCDELSTVVRDGNGDYLYDPPATDAWGPDPATTPADEDPFSEVQMYYHVLQAYSYFQAFANPAFTQLDHKPIQATVNFRIPIDYTTGGLDFNNLTNPNGVLYAFPNAMFMPPGQLIPGLSRPASIVFGQGEGSDFAYDGDVVFHEFTHAVIDSTCNLMGPGFDEQGLDPAPTGLNEGFADIFAAFISGDGQTGEYAAGELGGIRDLERKYYCPDVLWGEAHQDSMAFSWTVWSVRHDLGADADAPVFAALVSLPSDASFTVATAAVEAELGDALGGAAATTAHDYFAAANLIDCRRVIDYTGPRPILMTEGTGTVGMTPVPGYLQFKYHLAGRAQALRVEFNWSGGVMSFMGGGTPAYSVYVRKGAPITWNYTADPPATKDYDFALTGENQNARFTGELAQLLDPGDYYLMIVSTGSAGGTLQSVAITHVAAPQDDAAVPQDDAGTGDDAGDGGGGRKGCDCRANGTPAAGGLLALLGLALLLVRRRR
ncbi:MAG: hypothetical protein HY906_12310 [Deltaproteobacteria bacterium]|nr:hypothetical protein [Deltaproteobacteria bacterium]